VAVPLVLPGPAGPSRHALGLVLSRDRLLAALGDQRLPAEARALVLDRARRIVATRPDDAALVGGAPSAALAAALAAGTGLVRVPLAPGEPAMVVAHALAPASGYQVAIGLPPAVFNAPLHAALRTTALVGLGLLAASLGFGAMAAGSLARALRRLGEPGPAPAPPALRELGELADSLARQAAERERAVAELRALFDGSPVGLIRGDAGGRVVDANDAFLRIVGMTRADLAAGRVRWDDLTPPEWIGRDEAAIAEAVRGGACAPYQKEYLRPDGSRVPVLLFFALLDRAQGAIAAFVIDLSDWAATEAALARLHEQMRLAIGAAGMFFWDWNLLTDTVEWSDGLEAACGLPPGGFGGSIAAFRALVHPEDLPRVEAALGRAVAGLAPYDIEFRMRRADGGLRWVAARGTVLRDGTGRPMRMIGIDFDVTDRRAAAAALEDSEASLRRVVAASGLATYDVTTGPAGTQARVSGAFRRLWGLAEDAAVDFAAVLARVHPQDRPGFEADHARLARQGGRFEAEFRVLLPEGGLRWLRSSGEGWPAAGDLPSRLAGVVMDITALKAAEAAAASGQARLAALIEALPVAVAVVEGPEGRFVLENAANRGSFSPAGRTLAEDAARAPRLDAEGRPIPLEDLPLARALWRGEVVRGLPLRRITGPDGPLRDLSVSAAPVRDAAGRVTGAVAAFLDLTEERAAARAEAEGAATLRALYESAAQMMGTVELRPDGDVLHLYDNPATCRFFAVPEGSTAGCGARALGAPETVVAAWRAHCEAAAAQDAPVAFEQAYPAPAAAAPPRLLAITVAPIGTGPEGWPRFSYLAEDVTQARDAAAALRRSEETLRDLVATLDLGAFMVRDFDGTIRRWSAGCEQLYGYGAAEAVGRISHALLRTEFPAGLAAVEAALRETGAWTGELRHRARDGSPVVVAASKALRPGTGGRPDAVLEVVHDLTAQRAAEAALRDALAELEAVYAAAPIGLCVLDRDLRFRRINERLAEINGLPAAAHLGRTVREVLPDLAPQAEPVLRGVLETGEPVIDLELTGETPARPGERRIWRESWFPLRDVAGAVTGVGVVAQEVTERHQAEAALAESEARFRGLAEAMPAIVFMADPEGTVTWLNAVAAEFTGLPPAELLGEGWTGAIHPEDREETVRAWVASVATGSGYEAEFRLRRHDGAWRWHLSRAAVERDAEGRVLRRIGAAVDIDDLRRAEAALAESEGRLRLALDAAELGTWSWDPATGAEDASARCRDLYGVQAGERFDRHRLLAALLPEDVPATRAALDRVLAAGADCDLEHRVADPHGGEPRWLRLRCRAFGPPGRLHGLRSVVADITAQKRAEAALREDRERLEARVAERTRALSLAAAELSAEMQRREQAQSALLQAQKLEALGQLTSGIAHDFNNVLAAVMGTLRLVERRAPGNEAVAGLVRNGLGAAERAAALIRQLLAFARREDLAPAPLDPAALLEGAEPLLRQALGAGIRLELVAEPEAWPVLGDPHRLEVALLNLAVNARDAMGGRGTLRIAAAKHAAGAERPPGLDPGADYVVLSVEDSGPGMPPEVLARAAEPFFTTKPRGQGTGLGLAMVQSLAHQSGGAMVLDSRPGEGTRVALWLPRTDARPEAAEPAPLAEAEAGLHGDARILVVDDDDAVRLVTAAQLRELGYEVLEANSAGTGLVQALAADPLDLVICDVRMPGEDGPSFAARLRAERPGLPVLFVTGYPDHPGLLGEAVLTKPFGPAQLGRMVLTRLGQQRPGTGRRPAGQGLRPDA
ncbi:PAS domain-containing protein, partial [Paracraurococcus ruber]